MFTWLVPPRSRLRKSIWSALPPRKPCLNPIVVYCPPVTALSGAVLWFAVGYSLSFVGDGPWLGTFERAFLRGYTMESVSPLAATIPELLFMFYQMTFAIITVALVAGSVADRMRFSAYLLFSVGWFVFVYIPLAHWIWGGGFLGTMGVLDFAGGLVVQALSPMLTW